MQVLTLKAKHDHLQKVASTRDYTKAISEFVWNSLDADASKVNVEFVKNPLGGIDHIRISDNGSGISKARADHDFESLGESWKREVFRTPVKSRVIHGKEGQGRLKFFSLARNARWKSVYHDGGRAFSISIEIDADNLPASRVSDPVEVPADTASGTCVELANLKEPFDFLAGQECLGEFGAIFSPYILQYPGVEIIYAGSAIDPNLIISRSFQFGAMNVACPGGDIHELTVRIIEWKSKTLSRKIYLGGESGVVLGSQAANIIAPDFDFSVYAYSPFFEKMENSNLLEFEDLGDADLGFMMNYIREKVGSYFHERQIERAGSLIQDLKNAGVYPYEGDPRDEVEKQERRVFDLATHAVSSYSKEFKKADNSIKKMSLSLLREAIRHNPESVSRILQAVFNLPRKRQDEFSNLLDKTELGHIIAASTLVADRIVALEVLKEMVFEPSRRKSIKERGELDVLIRDNTWIFGENFHITMAEAGLTKIMSRVSDELALKAEKPKKVRKADGKIGRIDSFMGRIVPHADSEYREFLLVELKRPSLEVTRKELDQLEDYVGTIVSQRDFINTETFWNFFLVTGEYDGFVKSRITQKDRPLGIFMDHPNHRVWVKSWSELIRSAESRLAFVQKSLQVQVSAEEINVRIVKLKSAITGENDSSSD